MQVGVGIAWQIVVNGQIDAINIDTAAEYVGSDTDALIELLEFLISLDAIWLSVFVISQ